MFKFKKYFLIALLIIISVVFSGCVKKSIAPEKITGYDQKTYHSEQYGFSVEFPNSWKDNFVIKEEMQNNVNIISFLYNQLPGQEYPIFRLAVYPIDVWQTYKNSQELILNQQVFAYTKTHVFVLVRTLDNPFTSPQMEQFSNLNREMSTILDTFKVDSGKEFSLNSYKVFFNNTKLNPEMIDCRLTYPVEKAVSGTLSYEEQSLRTLFSGPTDEQIKAGFQSFFNSSTAEILKSFSVIENVALVNLKDIRNLIPNANSSCGSAQFLAEIENTLKQFPHIYQVYLAIDEDPNKIYEWLQLGCTENNFYCDKTPFKGVEKEVDGTKIEVPTILNASTTMPEEKVVTSTVTSTKTSSSSKVIKKK